MSDQIPSITCGPPTLAEIKYYFSLPNPAGAASRVFEQQDEESSPELSDSFKEFLEAKKNEDSDDEGYGALEKTCFDIDSSRHIAGLKIRDSLLLSHERSSINVTKSRPHYITKEVSQDLNPLLGIKIPEQKLRTPNKQLVARDRFAHVKSPVAEYIHGVQCPLMSIKQHLEKEVTKSLKFNFEDSIVAENSEVKPLPPLPRKILLKSSKVEKIVSHPAYSIFAPTKDQDEQEILNYSFTSNNSPIKIEHESDGDDEGFKNLFA